MHLQGQAVLYPSLQDLCNENQSMEDAVRERKPKTAAAERDVKACIAELETSRRSQRNLIDIVRACYSKVLNAHSKRAEVSERPLLQARTVTR